ncbi:hypothetical protein A7982_12467 [Minicystis rosea]|nr:hypothetical protein A7982_12467 [Minicystis rosea]
MSAMRLASVPRVAAAIGLAAIGLAMVTNGCGGSSCAPDQPADCAPLYEPTFDQVFARTLAPTCAAPGTGCHAAEGNQGGLAFTDADSAYALLLGEKDGDARVTPGDACSELFRRIASTDAAEVMPPGARLPDAERCAIEQWIRGGAKR